jgi:hypothetical protein
MMNMMHSYTENNIKLQLNSEPSIQAMISAYMLFVMLTLGRLLPPLDIDMAG